MRWLVGEIPDKVPEESQNPKLMTAMDLDDLRDLVAMNSAHSLTVDLEGYLPASENPEMLNRRQEVTIRLGGLQLEAPEALIVLTAYGHIDVMPTPHFQGTSQRISNEHHVMNLRTEEGKVNVAIIDRGGQLAIRAIYPIRPAVQWRPLYPALSPITNEKDRPEDDRPEAPESPPGATPENAQSGA